MEHLLEPESTSVLSEGSLPEFGDTKPQVEAKARGAAPTVLYKVDSGVLQKVLQVLCLKFAWSKKTNVQYVV